ncbi:RNA binding motif protein 12Bb [Paramormyrops kingsleyae]|nr:RNA-binding protein 12B-like [Paramormyrops kingsleyae]XP_023680067.1 RNA-binding protein 12B-like [Paramormyrops kingsleyae]
MPVVIRLQGLRITAGSEDIRNFFTGLRIPDGGVHIVGGEHEEAFIIFTSDEDARRAMTRSGGCIKGSPVNLLLSSKSEMKSVLEASMRKSEASKRRVYNEGIRRPNAQTVPCSVSENLSIEGWRMNRSDMGNSSGPVILSSPRPYRSRKTLPDSIDGLYLHLQGLPFSVTKGDVTDFFHELQVDDVILQKNRRGLNNGSGIVKFATLHDSREGLKRDREYIGSRFVEINACTEQQWIRACAQAEAYVDSTVEFGRKQSPVHVERRYGRDCTRSRSPEAYRSRSASPSAEEYCVLVENLSYTVEKSDLKAFFHPVLLKDDQIAHLFDRNGRKTRSWFVVFRSLRDYCAGLAHHKVDFANRTTYVSPVSKEKMLEMLESAKMKLEEHEERASKSFENSLHYHGSQKICLYVRNLPFDVRKVEIVDFFQGFGIPEDNVYLLQDDKGVGLGEGLVIFRSEEEALRAEVLNGERFLGSEVMLKSISRAQMQEFGILDSLDGPSLEKKLERYSSRHGRTSPLSPGGEYSDFGVLSNSWISPSNLPDHSCRSSSRSDSRTDGRATSIDRGDGSQHRRLGATGQPFDGPTCVKLVNLPPKITIEEIYDFCYGYRVIPGSVSLQCNKNGIPKGTATVVFHSRQEAMTALQELSGRPIGTRKIKLLFI